MNKNDLIQKLADHTGLAKHDAAKAVDGVFDVIAACVESRRRGAADGLWRVCRGERAGGKGRNPANRRRNHIKPSKQPRFRAGKGLKDALN